MHRQNGTVLIITGEHDMSEQPQASAFSVVPKAKAKAALEKAETYARSADAPATLRAYRADWEGFAAWCGTHGFVPVPAVGISY